MTLSFVKSKLCTHIICLSYIIHSYIVHVLFVSDTNLDCNMVHVPYVRYHNAVTLSNSGENRPALTNYPSVSRRRSVTVNQPGKMAENRISLINAGPRLNADLAKTPGQKCRILIKRRGRLIEKIRYVHA